MLSEVKCFVSISQGGADDPHQHLHDNRRSPVPFWVVPLRALLDPLSARIYALLPAHLRTSFPKGRSLHLVVMGALLCVALLVRLDRV